jgi:Domain of unknown function (DUF5916)
MNKILITILFISAFFIALANSKETERKVRNQDIKVVAVHINNPIVLDGKLNEEVWKDNPGISNFIQRDPDEGVEPTQKTIVHIAYDNNAIYIAARMYDTHPDSIISRLARRDVDIDTDGFQVFLDPYYDRRSGFYFALSAAGTQYDGVLYNDDWNDNSWDGVWEGKVNIDSVGWTAEMRIPFSQLRFQDKDKNIWGINFKRIISRRNENDYLVYVPKNESGFVSHFAELKGINDIHPSKGIEILPYITTRAEYSLHDPNNPFNNGSKYTPAVGADFKMALGTNLTLNATVNPDFGQVEIDPAVINLSAVETFFDEKRPFFIEGSTIFNFGQGGARNYWGFNWGSPDFFYSRRIGRTPQGDIPDNDFQDVPGGTHILGAAKLSGKVFENWNIGAVSALTQREYADYSVNGDKSNLEVEPLTYYGVVRGQKEINEGKQGVGFISTLTSRMFKYDGLRDNINKSAFTGGIDGWTFLDSSKTWVATGWLGMSSVTGTKERMIDLQESSRHYFQRPDSKYLRLDSNATSLTGYSGRFYVNKQKGNVFVNTAFGFISPSFDVNDLGFLWRSDVINMHLGAGYFWDKPTSFYHYLELGGALFRSYDYDGDITWEGIFHFGNITFPNYYNMWWNLAYNPQTVNNTLTRGGPLSINTPGYEIDAGVSSDSRKNWVVSFSENMYQQKNSKSWNLSASVELRPSSNVTFSVGPFYNFSNDFSQYIDTFDDPVASATFNKRYVFGELDQKTIGANIRLNWTFTPKLSLQFYAQPLISTGNYTNIKELAHPKTYGFNVYQDVKLDDGTYTVDPDGAGLAQQISFDDPNFNFLSLRGNAVLRWEYSPGSVIYFVWTQSRSESENIGNFQFGRSTQKLLDLHPDNIYMIKFTYWFNM